MIGERLKEERERLRLTQPVFAAQANTKKGSVINWEKGASSPTAVQLAALADIGVDVQYVVTGRRSEEALSEEVVEIIRLYQNAPIQVRAAVHGALTAGDSDIGKPNKTVVKNNHGGRIAGNNYYEGK